MKSVSAGGLALLARIAAGERIGWVQLIEMQISTTLRMTTAGHNVTWSGFTWVSSGAGTLQPIQNSPDELTGLEFQMPGILDSDVYLVLQEPVEGKTVRVWDALLDPDTGQPTEVILAWAGRLNVPVLTDGPQAVVTVTAEHRGVQATRPKPSRYTNAEQQALYPGDTCLDFDPATDAAPIIWPKKEFFAR